MSDLPKAQEWWEESEGTRVYIVGFRSGGDMVIQHECGTIGIARFDHKWKRLDGCTGWNWDKPTEADLTAALVFLRDKMDRLAKRVDRLESAERRERAMGAVQ
jgi:hypothetical protein